MKMWRGLIIFHLCLLYTRHFLALSLFKLEEIFVEKKCIRQRFYTWQLKAASSIQKFWKFPMLDNKPIIPWFGHMDLQTTNQLFVFDILCVDILGFPLQSSLIKPPHPIRFLLSCPLFSSILFQYHQRKRSVIEVSSWVVSVFNGKRNPKFPFMEWSSSTSHYFPS